MPSIFEREPIRNPEWETRIENIKQIYEFDKKVGLSELEMFGGEIARKNGLRNVMDDEYFREIEKVFRLPLSESLLIYITYVNNGSKSHSRRVSVMRDLKEKFLRWSKQRSISENDYWMFEVLMGLISKEFSDLRNSCDLLSVMEHLGEIVKDNAEVRIRVLPILVTLLRSTDIYDKQDVIEVIKDGFETDEVICIAAEYFRESEEQDSFYARNVIDMISRRLEEEAYGGVWWGESDEDIPESLRLLFQTLEGVWPTIQERGHEKILIGSLKSLSLAHPGVLKYMSRELRGKLGKMKKEVDEEDEGGGWKYERKLLWSSFGFLSELYGKVSDSQRERLDKYINADEVDCDVVEMLRNVFDSRDTNDLDEDYYYANIHRGELNQVCKCLSKNSMVVELMGLMANDPKYRFQMGVLLSMMDYEDLPVRVKRRIAAVVCNSEQELKIKHSYWMLCDDAEPRLADALYNGAVMLVNDHLLVKFKGKMTAVCLKTFTTKKGFTFLEGNWYSPVDDWTRERLKDAYDAGAYAAEITGDSEWVLMRKIEGVGENTDEEFMAEILRVLTTIELRKRKEFDTESD